MPYQTKTTFRTWLVIVLVDHVLRIDLHIFTNLGEDTCAIFYVIERKKHHYHRSNGKRIAKSASVKINFRRWAFMLTDFFSGAHGCGTRGKSLLR